MDKRKRVPKGSNKNLKQTVKIQYHIGTYVGKIREHAQFSKVCNVSSLDEGKDRAFRTFTIFLQKASFSRNYCKMLFVVSGTILLHRNTSST